MQVVTRHGFRVEFDEFEARSGSAEVMQSVTVQTTLGFVVVTQHANGTASVKVFTDDEMKPLSTVTDDTLGDVPSITQRFKVR